MLPFCIKESVTDLEAWTVPVPTGWLLVYTSTQPLYLFNEVGSLGEELEEVQLEVGPLGSAAAVGRGASDNDGARLSLTVTLTRDSRYLLRVSALFSVEGGVVVLDGLVDLGVAVGGLDKALTFAFENLFSTRYRGVNQSSDLETRTELVLETERVAVVSGL